MKNINYMLGLGFFAASLAASAQTTIYQNGFENSDKPEAGKYSSKYALSPGKSIFGDWVNPKDDDVWVEQSSDDPHSGEYCFSAENGDNNGNESYSWDRGFKIANLNLKENTAYRVGFWLQTNGETKVSSWLSQGIENFDKSICTPDGTNFGIDSQTLDTEGQWKHYSFVSYYAGQAPMLKVIENQSWVGNATFPGEFGGDGAQNYKDFFGGNFPDETFFILNIFSNYQAYKIDDISIQEGVAFSQATYSMDAIRLDFGYNTNIKELADSNGGFYLLDKSCAKVTKNGQEVEIASVECQSDGYLYVFLEEEAEDTDKLVVSFTPAEDCPIVYVGQKRPSADYDSEMKILGFANEEVYYDDSIDVLPSSWSAATLISTTPENDSFDLRPEEIKTVTFTFNKEMNGNADAKLTWADNFGTYEKEVEEIQLSEDKKSLIVVMPADLADGDYKLILMNAENAEGMPNTRNEEVSFSKGQDTSDAEPSTVIYKTDFDNEPTDCIPVGWNTFSQNADDAGNITDLWHIYGFNADGSQYNYGWGGQPGGGGARLYAGFSGDFSKALYWCSRSTNIGYASYGEQVTDYIDGNGNVDPNMPEGIALYLDPRKYQISFQMAAWKGNPKFRFTLEDTKGQVLAKFEDYTATPNMNGATGKVSGSLKCSTDFTVQEAGYYMLKFASQDAQWQEFLLANVSLITMPSKAAYYKNMLAEAAEKAELTLAAADDAEYNGATKTALAEAIRSAKNDRFTQGSKVEALCEELEALSIKLDKRVENIDQYPINVILLDEEIKALEEINPDYAAAPQVIAAKEYYNTVSQVNPSTLDDDALANAVKAVADYTTKVKAVPQSTEILTWGAKQAIELANKLGAPTQGAEKLLEDNRDVINAVNYGSKAALLSKLAAKEDIESLKTSIYDNSEVAEEWDDNDPNYNENGNPLKFKGINMSAYIYNPHLYRVLGNDGVPGWTVALGGGEGYVDEETGEEVAGESINIGYNATPSNENPVVDAQINIYGKTNYDFSQVIEGLPAGIYNVVIQTRTPKKAGNGVFTDEIIYYNAQDENGTWDKYIYAQGDNDSEVKMTPFSGADGLTTTFVEGVKVKDGKLTMGVHEYYVSGVARTWEPAADAATDATDGWLGTSYVDYANIYFVAPLDGYDYNAAVTAVESVSTPATIVNIYNINGIQSNKLQKGINIVKMSDGSVRKVLR